MREPQPVLTVTLFPELQHELLTLLESFTEAEWSRPTVCKGWSVKDVALHMLGDNIGVLSRRRDGHSSVSQRLDTWDELVAFLNDWNERWVAAARRISAPLLITLLRSTGDDLHRYFTSLDRDELGPPVSWAGPEPAPIWLDVAREYTEQWHHQQQIRDAVKREGAKEPELFAPVLAAFVRALPVTYRDVDAEDGTSVGLEIEGTAGGEWLVLCDGGAWKLYEGTDPNANARVRIDQERAWRVFTKTCDPYESGAMIEGDRTLGERMLETVSIIA